MTGQPGIGGKPTGCPHPVDCEAWRHQGAYPCAACVGAATVLEGGAMVVEGGAMVVEGGAMVVEGGAMVVDPDVSCASWLCGHPLDCPDQSCLCPATQGADICDECPDRNNQGRTT